MSSPFIPRVGGILSADIAVPEHEREVHFYSRVLTTGENPLWLIYLPVGDLAESVCRVEAEGGQIIKTTRGNYGEYASAVVQDLVGAYLALVPR